MRVAQLALESAIGFAGSEAMRLTCSLRRLRPASHSVAIARKRRVTRCNWLGYFELARRDLRLQLRIEKSRC